jgi:hypothetical protein
MNQGTGLRGTATFIYICCSGEARVGNTLTARLLLDYFLSSSDRAIGFETDIIHPALSRLFPELCSVADLSAARGQSILFDRLIVADGVTKVVDLWHAHLDLFVRLISDFDFHAEVVQNRVQLILLLHKDDRERFRQGHLALRKALPSAHLVMVHNRGVLAHEVAGPRANALSEIVINSLSKELRFALEATRWLGFRLIVRTPASTITPLEVLARSELRPIHTQFEQLRLKLDLVHAGVEPSPDNSRPAGARPRGPGER